MRIHFSNKFELFMIIIQAASYFNQIMVQAVIFPLPVLYLFLLFITNILSITIYLKANATHYYPQLTEKSSYCKTCKYKVVGRDHHCALIGRCVEKQNYSYFFGYVLYSYILSTLLSIRIFFHVQILIASFRFGHYWKFCSLWCGLVSGIYFAFFTGMLLSDSIRLTICGMYKVEEIKQTKKPKYERVQILKMMLNPKKWKILWGEFKNNWKVMTGKGLTSALIP